MVRVSKALEPALLQIVLVESGVLAAAFALFLGLFAEGR